MRMICENNVKDLPEYLDLLPNINCFLDKEYTPLHLASILNRTAILEYLILRGANPNHQNF